MKKILLTGGSGFIGRNIRESFLREKYELYAPTHHELDLNDEGSVQSFFANKDFDVVLHTAVKPAHRAAADQTQILLSNLRMFHNIAAHSDHFGKMIITGSGSIYDMKHYRPKVVESSLDEHIPSDELGLYKYTVWKLIEGKGKYLDLRIFGIYGKYEDYSIRFISNMICKALFDLPLTMNQDRHFDYLWIDDLYPVLEHFIEVDPPHGAYNVTSGSSDLLSDIAREVLSVTGKNLPIVIQTAGLGPEYSGDNSLLMDELPALRFTPLRIGIEKLTEYYRASLGSLTRAIFIQDR
jgi:UDP-glucose 4-epimerase